MIGTAPNLSNEFSDKIKEKLCVVFGDFPTVNEVNQRLARRGLKVTHTLDIHRVNKLLDNNFLSLIIIADSFELPAYIVLRMLLNHKIGHLVPILVINKITDRKNLKCIESLNLGNIASPRDYDNPANLISSTRSLTLEWSTPLFEPVLDAREQIINNNYDAALHMLKEVVSSIPVGKNPIIPSISKIYLLQGNFNEAESILLEALREKKINLRLLFGLVELYFSYSLYSMVERILDRIREHFGTFVGFNIDVIQMHIVKNDYESCIPLLKDLIVKKFAHKFAKQNLAKIYFACSYLEDLQKIDKEARKDLEQINYKMVSQAS